MSTVGLFVHTGRPEAITLAHQLTAWLHSHGHEVVASGDEVDVLDPHSDGPLERDHPSRKLDLVVAIGGDGTMLRATSRAVDGGAEVMGINLGQLGYLAEIEPTGWEEAMTAWEAGRHLVAERLMVAAAVDATGEGTSGSGIELAAGLNEVVIEKEALGRTVRLGVSIDGRFFTTYMADGLILATPTGSTAYSLSARGPIIDPSHRALLMTPVSPHSLFDRSLVLDPTSVVEVSVIGDRPASIAVDGVVATTLAPGANVTISAAPRPARFVTFETRDFHQILKAKFGLSDR